MLKHVLDIDLRKDNRKIISLMPFGDLHFGSEDCDEVLMGKYLNYAKKKKVYIGLMGDCLDLMYPSVIPHAVWQELKRPSEQEKEFIKLMMPYKDLVLWGIPGTHENWSLMRVDRDPMKHICEELDAGYLEWDGYVRILFGNQVYVFYVCHGWGWSINPRYQLLKALNIFDSPDCILIGHLHRLYHFEEHRIRISKGREYFHTVHLVRTGGALSYPNFARRKLLPPSRPGFALIYLHGDKHVLEVDLSRAPEEV